MLSKIFIMILAFIVGVFLGKESDRKGLFYVYNKNKDKPIHYHTDFKSAVMEAERIARKEPDDEIEVLEVLTTLNESDIPF